MVKKKSSPPRSFEGWDLLKWAKGNWSTLKELLKVGLPLLLTWAATSKPELLVLFTALGKFVMDCGEYYFTKQSLK